MGGEHRVRRRGHRRLRRDHPAAASASRTRRTRSRSCSTASSSPPRSCTGHPRRPGADLRLLHPAEATDLANVLKYGALPLTFDVGDVQQVSPTLGEDQLTAGPDRRRPRPGPGGGLLAAVLPRPRPRRRVQPGRSPACSPTRWSCCWARRSASRSPWPAIAGLIVAIGITADSFVVYFERIRDEVRDGRTLRVAVETGWVPARRTIIAADFVSLIAAVVLYVLSVGGVRGFAFTLGLTTLIDLLVVFLFTKPMVTLLARTRFFGGGHQVVRARSRVDSAASAPGATRASRPPVRTQGGLMSRLGTIRRRPLPRRGLVSTSSAAEALVRHLRRPPGGLRPARSSSGLNLGIEFRAARSSGARRHLHGRAGAGRGGRGRGGRVGDRHRVDRPSGRTIRVQTETLTPAESAEVAESLAEACDVARRRDHDPGGRAVVGRGDHQQGAAAGLVVFLVAHRHLPVDLPSSGGWRSRRSSPWLHDVVITVGIYALVGFEVTPATVIGVLTILGLLAVRHRRRVRQGARRTPAGLPATAG